MEKTAVLTDSNSGITQKQAEAWGIYVLPMPFTINEENYFEDIDLTQEAFYQRMETGAEISTSMPSIAAVTELWEELLEKYEEIVYIPMSSALSSSCETAIMCAANYDDRVKVVNNQRISVTQKRCVLDAKEMVARGWSGEEIKDHLEKTKLDSSIYIMLDTLYYLKKGGRITPAAAALGTLLRLKPVLQIQGGKLDAFAKARTIKQAKNIMIEAIQNDFAHRFGDETGDNMHIQVAYTKDSQAAEEFVREIKILFPRHEIVVDPLSLSVACHIGPGALALACSKKF